MKQEDTEVEGEQFILGMLTYGNNTVFPDIGLISLLIIDK